MVGVESWKLFANITSKNGKPTTRSQKNVVLGSEHAMPRCEYYTIKTIESFGKRSWSNGVSSRCSHSERFVVASQFINSTRAAICFDECFTGDTPHVRQIEASRVRDEKIGGEFLRFVGLDARRRRPIIVGYDLWHRVLHPTQRLGILQRLRHGNEGTIDLARLRDALADQVRAGVDEQSALLVMIKLHLVPQPCVLRAGATLSIRPSSFRPDRSRPFCSSSRGHVWILHIRH